MERYNCCPWKDDMIPFPFYENQFSFFVADHLLVGQLCTNPKSDRSLLSCLKVTQCSTSEIADASLYNSCSLPIQVMTTGHTLRTSSTWPPTTPKPAWLPTSTEYLLSSCWRLWKRHAPCSGFVSRRWLRLKVATLNRCQLYYIIELPELIFSIKFLK